MVQKSTSHEEDTSCRRTGGSSTEKGAMTRAWPFSGTFMPGVTRSHPKSGNTSGLLPTSWKRNVRQSNQQPDPSGPRAAADKLAPPGVRLHSLQAPPLPDSTPSGSSPARHHPLIRLLPPTRLHPLPDSTPSGSSPPGQGSHVAPAGGSGTPTDFSPRGGRKCFPKGLAPD